MPLAVPIRLMRHESWYLARFVWHPLFPIGCSCVDDRLVLRHQYPDELANLTRNIRSFARTACRGENRLPKWIGHTSHKSGFNLLTLPVSAHRTISLVPSEAHS